MDILIFSILSLLTTIVGLYLLGEKKAFGFLLFTASLSCQMYIFYYNYDCGVHKPNWFLVIQMIVLILFNLRNFRKWTKGEKDGSN